MLRAGDRIRARLLDVRTVETDAGLIRVAIVVPKFGFTSVRRNKLKRQLREITRAHVLTQPASYDVLLRARREAYDAGFATLRDDLVAAAAKLRPRASAT